MTTAPATHGQWAQDARPSGVKRLLPLLPALPLAAAAWWVLRFNPTDRINDPTGPCLWHALTGINGPSCGGTRMFYYLIHGDLIHAAQHHLLALIGILIAVYYWIAWAGRALFGLRLPMPRIRGWHIGVYIGLFLLYATVLRNLPWQPFAWFNIQDLTPAR